MRKLIQLIAIFLLFVTTTYAQRTISGRVITSETNEPLVEATIQVKGTLVGTTTDAEGRYSIYVPSGASSLVFNYTGYVSQEVSIGTKTVINVTLSEGLELENVTVVGSRNQTRTKLETPAPVDIIPISIVINEVGQVDLNQILNYAAPSFQSNRQTVSDGTDHIDPATLRGLGPDQVLVLINGKRRHNSALVNINGTVGRGSVGTDLSAIPAGAIERIEILRDGASAQYGSDAIAGIINIVMKKDAEVLSGNVSTGVTAEGDGDVISGTINYGFRLNERGYVNVTGEHTERGATNRMKEYTGPVFYNTGSEYAYNFEKLSSLNNRTRKQADDDSLGVLGVSRNRFNMIVGNSEVKSSAMFFNMMYPLSSNTEMYAFGGITNKKGSAAGFYRLPFDARNTPQIYPLGFLPTINTDIDDKALTLGLRGTIRNWNLDMSHSNGSNSFMYNVGNSLNASLLAASPTNFYAGGFISRQSTSNIDINRLFGNVLSGLNIAFGSEFRTDNYEIRAGEEASYRNYGLVAVIDTLRNAQGQPILQNGSYTLINTGKTKDILNKAGGAQVFPGFRPENVVNATRTSISSYSDIELDITENFLVETAVRVERYSDFGGTLNYKIASRYKLSNNMAIRGAMSTGFRAPSQPQKYFNNTSTQFDNKGVPSEIGTFTNSSRAAQLLGIPKLKQETSKNYSLGVTMRPKSNMEISLDAYLINIKDRIILTGQFEGTAGSELATLLTQANASKAAFFTNAVDTRSVGLDLVWSYDYKSNLGDFKFSVAGNFNRNAVIDSVGTNNPFVKASDVLIRNNAVRTYFNREDESRLEVANPRQKVAATINWKYRKFNVMLRNVYFGSVTYLFPSDTEADSTKWLVNMNTYQKESRDQVFAPKIITDLTVGYQITPILNFTIGANNLFNIYPDQQKHSENVSYGRFLYSRRVQQFGFNGAYYFTRLVFNLR